MQVVNHYNLFYDIKEIYYMQEKFLDRIMVFFCENNQVDIENSRFARSIYRDLGFGNYTYFDVINSFWTVFTCGLAITNDLLVEEKRLGKRYYEFSDDKKMY